jgi:hypothetical protein
MNAKIVIGIMVGCSLGLGVYGARQWVSINRAQGEAEAVEQASGWSPTAKLVADLMIERYGPPQEISSFRLQWNGVLPWKNIIIQDEQQAPLQQIVTYHVPADKIDELMKFSHGPLVYPDENELVARGDSEEINRLSLNLADDIATGRKSAEEADRFFQMTVMLQAAGKSSPYLERLLFAEPPVPLRPYPYPL